MNNIIWDSFAAFHINGINNLKYILMNNSWFLIICGSCICMMILSWREKKSTVIREEQNIL